MPNSCVTTTLQRHRDTSKEPKKVAPPSQKQTRKQNKQTKMEQRHQLTHTTGDTEFTV